MQIYGALFPASLWIFCVFFSSSVTGMRKTNNLEISLILLWRSGIEWALHMHHAPERLQRQDSASLPGNYFMPSKPLGTHHSRPTHGLAATHLPERLPWPPAWEHIDLLVLKHLPLAFYCILPICVQLRDVHTGRHSLLYIWQSEFNIFYSNA